MKILLIISTLFLLANDQVEEPYYLEFFNDALNFECIDKESGRMGLRPKYYELDYANGKILFLVPDTMKHSGFYNSFGSRLMQNISSLISPSIYDSLMNVDSCNSQLCKERFVKYIDNNTEFKNLYNCYFNSYNNRDCEKMLISKDSLLKITLEYFTIDKVDTTKNFILAHFCGGSDPFRYDPENYKNLTISGFCHEAVSNKSIIQSWSNIVNDFESRLDNGLLTGDPEILRKKLDNELKSRMLSDSQLAEIMMNYYQDRKDIEPFKLSD